MGRETQTTFIYTLILSPWTFPLIHSLKIGHLLWKIFDTSTFTRRSLRTKSAWESVLCLQHQGVFCCAFTGCPVSRWQAFLLAREAAHRCLRAQVSWSFPSKFFPLSSVLWLADWSKQVGCLFSSCTSVKWVVQDFVSIRGKDVHKSCSTLEHKIVLDLPTKNLSGKLINETFFCFRSCCLWKTSKWGKCRS